MAAPSLGCPMGAIGTYMLLEPSHGELTSRSLRWEIVTQFVCIIVLKYMTHIKYLYRDIYEFITWSQSSYCNLLWKDTSFEKRQNLGAVCSKMNFEASCWKRNAHLSMGACMPRICIAHRSCSNSCIYRNQLKWMQSYKHVRQACIWRVAFHCWCVRNYVNTHIVSVLPRSRSNHNTLVWFRPTST